ncbi:xanthine dehydrogenase family protein molybdopterin-binding subunit [Cupriavidus pinatubonensis]|uniref:Caffeine dehydrogenase subunit alpha n=1 Tax=Cupriavidus pinatubonensis TaxID=248026 RepID=A0ABM8Y4C2_9BURK|nr:xanthine dehydrogenase family protein molybdopterin-binding subunit [Cupriavidus pinatubonensis]CAG9187617.1 Caffeine dehydrogenase subunit alpha [Cupriavidus pinatubonensis]
MDNIDLHEESTIPSVIGTRQRYIGAAARRPTARKLLQGRGTYLDDVVVPRLAHAVYLRSPMAHAKIGRIDTTTAAAMPGVIAIVDGRQVAALCSPWVGTLKTLSGMKSAPQYPLAIDIVRWQGEPVLAVVAESRQQAEDAMQMIEVEWEELPAVTDMETALDKDTPIIHPDLGDNLCFTRTIDSGDVDYVFDGAAICVEQTFRFGRHTGLPMETRAILADFDPAEHRLTVYQSHQAPHSLQNLYAKHFDFEENAVRVICKDVGGSFGIKLHTYPDDFATVALSILLRRPVKYVADRLESFVSDIHAREHVVRGRIAMGSQGDILAFDIDDLTGIGPFSVYPRTSVTEGNQVISVIGGPYSHLSYRARLRVVFQNKVPTSQYRGVGLPIACAVTEGLVDAAARKLGLDPFEVRQRNVVKDDAYPYTSASGVSMHGLSHQACLEKLKEMMGYSSLRAEQKALRDKGIYRGIGISVLIEMTNPGAAFYGMGGAEIAGQDGATVRLDAGGALTCLVGVGEQGQGTETVFAQIVADAVGAPIDSVKIITGDTAVTPYGAGTWASRGAGIGGEAVLQAGLALKKNIRAFAAALKKRSAEELDVRDGVVIEAVSGDPLITLAELAHIAYFRTDTLPVGELPELMVTRQYSQNGHPFLFTNAAQASYVEVDVETGFVKLLGHWAVGDCGRVLNPMLASEQVRGGIVQGIGDALFEECLYDDRGLLRNGSMADYLVPMASEMPDITVAHIETPTDTSQLGAKGTGESGTGGAPGAVMNAINDALSPFSASVTSLPITPEKILRAMAVV